MCIKIFQFIDVRKNCLENKNFLETLLYGKVKEGINIIGICKCKKCKAFNQKIAIPLEGKLILNMKEDDESLLCPLCEKVVTVLTVGFNRCKYLIRGSVIEEEGSKKNFEISGMSPYNVQYFSPDKCGLVKFSNLIIIVDIILSPLIENNSNIFKYLSY